MGTSLPHKFCNKKCVWGQLSFRGSMCSVLLMCTHTYVHGYFWSKSMKIEPLISSHKILTIVDDKTGKYDYQIEQMD